MQKYEKPVVVKGRQVMEMLNQIHQILTWLYTRVNPMMGYWIGIMMLILVLVDSTANNWAINDFCGNGLQFRTPVARSEKVNDLANEYTFANGHNLTDLSNIGHWMTDYVVRNLYEESSLVYIISGGSYPITGSEMNYCGSFNGNYKIDLNKPLKLAVANDAITYLRGNSLTHITTNDLIDNLPLKSSKSIDLDLLGYTPSRMQVDMKMTTIINLKNITKKQTILTTWYRIYSKSYCTGCIPIAELGRGICNLTIYYNDTINEINVNSTFVLNSIHDFGLLFHRDIYTTISSLLKYLAIFIAIAGYLASRKTVQWHEINTNNVETVWNRIIQMISPKYFPHLSYAIRFDLFCYNSDIFVFLFVLSNLLDMNHSLIFIREVNVFNQNSIQYFISFQLFALSTRLLWLNLGLLKIIKILIYLITSSIYSGQNKFIFYFNFSSVNILYLSAILLYFVPPYIEYNNNGRWDVSNKFDLLDGKFVNYFNSFYFRVSPAITVGLILNILLILFFDHFIFYTFWKNMKKNSLCRQAIYNSTSVITEFLGDIKKHDGNIIIQCRARRLSTLQWYFTSHMWCFSLPEKEMSKKKGITSAAMSKEEGVIDNPTILCTVGQSDTGHVHLFDENLHDIKSLAFNIKILKNSYVLIK